MRLKKASESFSKNFCEFAAFLHASALYEVGEKKFSQSEHEQPSNRATEQTKGTTIMSIATYTNIHTTEVSTVHTERETALRTARTRNFELEEAIFLSFPALRDAARQAAKLEGSLSSIGLSPAARAVFVQEAFAPIVQAIFLETTCKALLDSLHEDEEAALIERARVAAFSAFSARSI